VSDEQLQQQQVQVQVAQAEAQAGEPTGNRWGDPISEERQAELQGYLDRWAAETDHSAQRGPFDGGLGKGSVRLSGADVSWLAKRSGGDKNGRVPDLHLEGAHLDEAHLEGAYLGRAHLEGADLYEAHLEGAVLAYAHLEGAVLGGAHLERAALHRTHLETLYVNPF